MVDTENVTDASITVVPASEAPWDDVQAIFGSRGYPSTCQCQFFKIRDSEWKTVPLVGHLLRDAYRVPSSRRQPSACARDRRFARDRGARAVEGYPMITEPGKEYTWGELFVGSRSIFADAGFVEVSRPTLRRVVMRVEFRRPVSDVN